MKRIARFTIALGILAGAGRAGAVGPADVGVASGIGSVQTTGAERFQRQPYWELGPSRFFAAAAIDAGYLYFRPQLALGYGRPHSTWIGLELYPSLSTSGMVESIGLHGATPWFEIRTGARYLFTFSRHFLQPKDAYYRDDVETRYGPKSRYVSLDLELSASRKLFYGNLFGVLGGYAITGAPSGYYVFDEALHAVVKPPYVMRGRLGYVLKLGLDGEVTFGAFNEVIEIPGRSQAIWRAGPIAGLQLSDHLDLLATFAFVIASDDELGLAAADIGQLGVRYRWATGEPAPWTAW